MDLSSLVRQRLAQEGGGWLSQLLTEISSTPVAASPSAPQSSGGRRSARRARPPSRLSPSAPAVSGGGRGRGSRALAPPPGASRRRRRDPPPITSLLQISAGPQAFSPSSAPPQQAASVTASAPPPLSQAASLAFLDAPAAMGSRASVVSSSEESAVPPSQPPAAALLPLAVQTPLLPQSPSLFPELDSPRAPATAAAAPPIPPAAPLIPTAPPHAAASTQFLSPPPPPLLSASEGVACCPHASAPPHLGIRPDSCHSHAHSTEGARRRSRHGSRPSRSARRSRRSRSSRWNSPSSSAGSSASSSDSSGRDRRRHKKRGRGRSQPAPAPVPLPAAGGGTLLSPMVLPSSTAGSGESPYAGVWGAGLGPSLVPALRALADQLSSSPSSVSTAPPPPAGGAGLHKEFFFCGVSPLGSHLDEETRQKIWDNKFVDIWSLISADQHTVDRERRVGDRPFAGKPRVAKTICNWMQAFSVLGCVMGQKHPERCSELFIYQDMIYSSFKSHGGSAWWRYDEEFRRRLALQPEMGWGVKATDVWLRLMLAPKQQPFQPAAAHPGPLSGQGGAAVRRPGACWMFNEGHCRFFGLCKYRHECSACGGAHAATKCPRPASKLPGKPGVSGDTKDAGERGRDGPLARPLS